MALFEQIRDALGSYVPSDGEEINLKIKPAMPPGAASVAPGQEPGTSPVPQFQLDPREATGFPGGLPRRMLPVENMPLSSAAGAGGAGGTGVVASAGQSAGTPTPDFPAGQVGFGAGGQSVVAPNMRLSQNAQLPGVPGGAYQDSIFEAALAQARHETQRQYADILQQLGHTDAQGNFIPGMIETEAARKRADLTHQQQVAREETTAGAQRGGTVFSGRRGTLQGRAERPFVTGLAQLESDTPLQLGKAYQTATDILGSFGINMNALIAEATQRKATLDRQAELDRLAAEDRARAAAGPPAAGGGGGEPTPEADIPNEYREQPTTPSNLVPAGAPGWFKDPSTGVLWQDDGSGPRPRPGFTERDILEATAPTGPDPMFGGRGGLRY